MTWKKKVRRMAAKVAPTKLNAKDKNVDWKNTKDKKPNKELEKADWKDWLANKKKERDGEGIEPTTSGNPNQWHTNMSGSVRDKHRCIMCSRALNHSHPATVTDPQTGFKYCRPCAKKKGLV
jgi:hypothetical protein